MAITTRKRSKASEQNGSAPEVIEVRNPATGEVIDSVPKFSPV
jgi:hypothetical protein